MKKNWKLSKFSLQPESVHRVSPPPNLSHDAHPSGSQAWPIHFQHPSVNSHDSSSNAFPELLQCS